MPKADKSKKNGESRMKKEVVKRALLFSRDVPGTVYGQVLRALGDCNFSVFCFDGQERLCHIRKAIKRGERAEVDSIVLVGIRDFSESKGDIVYIYTKEQASDLRKIHEIPAKVVKDDDGDFKNEEDDIEFDSNFDIDQI
jgi:translation initiation factor 1A